MTGDGASRDAAQDVLLAEQRWRSLRRYAGRHAGYFTARQAWRIGCAARVRSAIGEGAVTEVEAGVLRLAEWPSGPMDEYAMWAVWFEGAVAVSHHSAAELHGLGRLRPRFLHVSVRSRRWRATAPARLVVLRRAWNEHEVASAGPFLVTTPVRTVVDLARTDIGAAALAEVVADAMAIHRCAPEEIEQAGMRAGEVVAERLRRAVSLG